jgi:hypothetical protein
MKPKDGGLGFLSAEVQHSLRMKARAAAVETFVEAEAFGKYVADLHERAFDRSKPS